MFIIVVCISNNCASCVTNTRLSQTFIVFVIVCMRKLRIPLRLAAKDHGIEIHVYV